MATAAERTIDPVAADGDCPARAPAKQSKTVADTDIVRRPAQRVRYVERFGQVPRPSMSTTGYPVVLLVQRLHDDGLEMYAEYLRYSGLAAIAVSNAKDALTFAPEADIIVTGIVLETAWTASSSSRVCAATTARCTSPSSCSPLVRGAKSGSALNTRGAMYSYQSRASRMPCCARCGCCYPQRMHDQKAGSLTQQCCVCDVSRHGRSRAG